MAENLNLKTRNLPKSEWIRAPVTAKQFLKDYPDRYGVRNGVVYVQNEEYDRALYVYRTKTCVVVAGTWGHMND